MILLWHDRAEMNAFVFIVYNTLFIYLFFLSLFFAPLFVRFDSDPVEGRRAGREGGHIAFTTSDVQFPNDDK